MENLKQLLNEVALDKRTAVLLTGGVCFAGAVAVLVGKVNIHREAREKIRRARNRRTESLQQAERAVFSYKASVRAIFSLNNN